MLKRIVLVTVGISLITLTAVHAQRRSTTGTSLTPLDYYEIQQLYARFSHGLDSAADNGNLFARAFTPDGVYVDQLGRVYQGREQLAALARQDPESRKGPTNMSLYNTNIRIEPAPGGAIGTSYLMVVGRRQAGQPAAAPDSALTDAGQYWDAFVKTPEGWRIQKRAFTRPNSKPASRPMPTPLTTAGQAWSQPAAPAITAEDYAEIQQLYARYTFTWDGILDDGQQWIELFTPDGSHRAESGAFPQIFYGREELRGMAREHKLKDNRVPESMRHFITNFMLDRTPEGITVKAYRMGVNVTPNGQITLGTSGIYFDYLVKTPQGWLYHRKNFITANGPVPEAAKPIQARSSR